MKSQCDRVLDVLREGGWKSIGEIHERAGTMRLNSRVSDLRKRGLNIEYRMVNGLHSYRLVALDEPGGTAAETPVVLPGSLSASLQEVAAPSGGGVEAAASWSVGPPLDVPPHEAGLPQGAPAGAGLTDTDCSWPGPLQLQLDAA